MVQTVRIEIKEEISAVKEETIEKIDHKINQKISDIAEMGGGGGGSGSGMSIEALNTITEKINGV